MSKLITLRVPEDVLTQINDEAAAQGISRTAILLRPWAKGPQRRAAEVVSLAVDRTIEHSQVHNRAKALHRKCEMCGIRPG